MALETCKKYFYVLFFLLNLLTHLYETPERSKYPAAKVLPNMYAAGLAKKDWKRVGLSLMKMLFLVKDNKITVCVNHGTSKSSQKPGK